MNAHGFLVYLLVIGPTLSMSQPKWELLPNSPTSTGRHDDVFFLSPTLGWVVNGDGEVHRTTDGGETWVLQSVLAGEYGRCVGFVDSLHGWVGTLSVFVAGLFATSDGGFTWNRVTNFSGPPPESVCGISIVNDSVIYASGAYYGHPSLIKTTDRGTSWSGFALDSLAGALVDCRFVTPDSGIVVGSTAANPSYGRAVVLSTADGGTTWKTNQVGGRDGELCWKISFLGPDVGFVSIEASLQGPVYFLKTTNQGESWEEKLFQASHRDEQGIGFVSDSLGWIGGWGGETYGTTDGGNTWTAPGPGRFINRFRFLGDSLGFAVGDRVYKYSRDSVSTTIPQTNPTTVQGFELSQNFPNPFNPTTTIRFSLPESSPVKLSILDLLGRSVVTIVDGLKSPGEHVTGWDGRDASGAEVSSGVYIYRMQTPNRALSRKLMLLR